MKPVLRATKRLASITIALLVSGCTLTDTASKSQHIESRWHQYRLQDTKTLSDTTLSQLTQQLADADVIFIGEYHTHSASHLLQARLLYALHQQNSDISLSMEQFSRDKQSLVNDYLNGTIGEQTLIKQGDAWDNYESDYRPLVEYAKEHGLDVIAANTPLSVVRCVARKGPQYIKTIPLAKQGWVAKDITSSSQQYQDKFAKAMGHHGTVNKKVPVKPSNSFYAQLSRDNTMAESIHLALRNNPKRQIIHINGAFHSNYGLGTVDALKRLDPTLKIKVISPQFLGQDFERGLGDFVYTIKPMPTRYVQKDQQRAAIKEMMAKRKNNRCEL